MFKNCLQCNSNFEIVSDDLKFYEKISPVFNDKKYLIPPPSLCPECRMQRRLAYRNDRSLFKSKSDFSGQPIISMYNPEYGCVVYDQKEWWSDKWDGLEYEKEFDFNKSFFEQFYELQKKVPRFNVFNRDTENCDFVNYAPHCKNCYLIFGSWFNEDCLYGQTLNECKDCIDNLFLDRSQFCYENINCNNNYESFFCQNSDNLMNCYFCFDCKNCNNCIGCFNLRKKEYYILNEKVSKEEFESQKNKFSSYADLIDFKNKYYELIKNQAIHKALSGSNNENVTGDFIYNCKNAKHCFSAYRSQDIAYSSRVFEMKDSYDFEGGGKGELIYESMSNDFSYNSIACTTCENLTNSHYCDLCFNCENCFGCIGLKHKKYCVFNKQYTKEEYEKLVPKIIEAMKSPKSPLTRGLGHPLDKGGLGDCEWGEFFPISKSPFCYNETMANEYFPLSQEEAITKEYRWLKDKKETLNVQKIIQANLLPDLTKDIPDDILNWAILPENLQMPCNGISTKPFKMTKSELNFYRKMNLPIPRRHPDQRHKDRMTLRNPRKLWTRNCMKCNIEVQTTYYPERPEIVHCEQCYLKEIA
ncbi:hypothetical protein A2272_03445 [Candidatus Peregrinibacteria bacterium RIFOXYA12_FULL_33_12]|nr:MAG: hypothetical protein A2272_03445 [Candidatus Peregrinibacteria bacterium RIFOXYA12_FULL_33_12]